MKKILSLALVFVLILCAFAACKEEKDEGLQASEALQNTQSTQDTESSQSADGEDDSSNAVDTSSDAVDTSSDSDNSENNSDADSITDENAGEKAFEKFVISSANAFCAADSITYEGAITVFTEGSAELVFENLWVGYEEQEGFGMFFDKNFGADVYLKENFYGTKKNCFGLRISSYLEDMSFHVRFYIPTDTTELFELAEKMGIPSNDLLAFSLTTEDIKAMDAETATLFIAVLESAEEFTPHISRPCDNCGTEQNDPICSQCGKAVFD